VDAKDIIEAIDGIIQQKSEIGIEDLFIERPDTDDVS